MAYIRHEAGITTGQSTSYKSKHFGMVSWKSAFSYAFVFQDIFVDKWRVRSCKFIAHLKIYETSNGPSNPHLLPMIHVR
jgi:hypothetical protein